MYQQVAPVEISVREKKKEKKKKRQNKTTTTTKTHISFAVNKQPYNYLYPY